MYDMITLDLLTSYREAKYIVKFEDAEYRIKVGDTCKLLDHILEQRDKQTAYFITPANPFSCMLTDQENALRNTRFCAEITEHSYFYLVGYGTDEAEKWGREISYLIFTDDEAAMQNLAARFGQNAFLKIPYKSPVQLLVLDSLRYIQC
jgi:hypoxanthine-guanine phosphoribosyltransferase